MGTENAPRWSDPEESPEARHVRPGHDPVEDPPGDPIEDLADPTERETDPRAMPPTRADLGGPTGASNTDTD